MKPEITHELKTGRALGAQRGFATTFNWMLNFCRNLRGMDGVEVDRNDSDHPIIRVKATGGGGTHPFAIRYYKKDPSDPSEAGGRYGWKIYLPPGCVSVGGTCEPLNLKMREISGHEDEGEYWYNLYLSENYGQQREETEDGVTVYYRDFEVIVHAKTRAKVYGVDELSAPSRRMFFVEARSVRTNNGNPRTAQQEAYCFEGDEFSQVVATVSIRREPTDSETIAGHKFTRTVHQTIKSAISVAGRAAQNFDLEWYFENLSEDVSEIVCSKVYCVRNQLSAAGITLHGPTRTEVTNAQESVYAKILTNPLNPNANDGSVEIVTDPSGMTNDDDITWLNLYSMSYKCVTADWRAQSLVNVQVYR